MLMLTEQGFRPSPNGCLGRGIYCAAVNKAPKLPCFLFLNDGLTMNFSLMSFSYRIYVSSMSDSQGTWFECGLPSMAGLVFLKQGYLRIEIEATPMLLTMESSWTSNRRFSGTLKALLEASRFAHDFHGHEPALLR